MTTETVSPPVQVPRDKAIILELLPEQGEWDQEEYLWLSGRTNRLVEYVDGRIEVVSMPSDRHLRIMLFLYRMLYAFLSTAGFGIVFVAPVRLRLSKTKYRDPDIMMLLDPGDPRREDGGWSGADLVVEIVSPDDPERDLVTKRRICPGRHS